MTLPSLVFKPTVLPAVIAPSAVKETTFTPVNCEPSTAGSFVFASKATVLCATVPDFTPSCILSAAIALPINCVPVVATNPASVAK